MVKTGLHGLNLRKITQRKTTFPCYINHYTWESFKVLYFHYWQNPSSVWGGKAFTCSFFPSYLFQIKNVYTVYVWKNLIRLFFEQINVIGYKSTWKVSDGHEAVCTADLCHAEHSGVSLFLISFRSRHRHWIKENNANVCITICNEPDAKKKQIFPAYIQIT